MDILWYVETASTTKKSGCGRQKRLVPGLERRVLADRRIIESLKKYDT